MEDSDLPIEIYNEQDIFDRMREKVTFRPKYTAIAYIRKGNLSFIVNGEARTCGANQMLFISNRNVYAASMISDDIQLYITRNNRFSYKSPNFSFNHFEIFKLIAIENESAVTIPEKEFQYIWSLLDNIYYQFKKVPASNYKTDILMHLQAGLIYSIIGHLELLDRPLSFSHTNRKQVVTTSFIELLFENYREERELKFYADRLHISVKYLSICVKEVTGFPPTYFLNQLSMYDARIRLSDKTVTISDIADELNFSDQYAFSKFFRKNMGMSPSEYRKKALETDTI